MTKLKTKPKPSENNKALDLQAKFALARKDMNLALVEREEEIDLVLTALIAQHHVLLVGPPGVAKSLVVESVKDWIEGARKCVVHCCKDTTRNMAFGPIDLQSIKEKTQRRVLDGGAADSHVLILEEVFKAGPAVLDMFLLLMNERRYQEGVFHSKCPLRLLLGVSNEWSPEGCETALAAFFDRFLFRKAVHQIRSRDGKKKLLAKAVANDNCKPKFSCHVSLEEVDAAHVEAMDLPWSNDGKKALWEILEELNKEGVVPTDRRGLYQDIAAARAYAYLNGAGQVLPEHLEVLQHVLWIDPNEQPAVVTKVVQKIANPIGMLINSKLIEVEDVLGKAKPTEAVPKLQAIQKELAALKADPRKDKALAYVTECIKESYDRVIGLRKEESDG